MNLTIHRGSKEIGGTCIELATKNTRILLDLGLPIVDENREQIDSRKLLKKSNEQLIADGVLPSIAGLYDGEPIGIDAILLSHPHPDHYGLLSRINKDISIYMSLGCKLIVEASHYFGQTECSLQNVKLVSSWEPVTIGDFTVTPHLVDHSGFDAFAFLIEADGKKVFYSGDFRGHGRKKILFDKFIENPPADIDCLILEGSMLGRDSNERVTEHHVENDLTSLFKTSDELLFVACSTQNIDRLVSIYKACKATKRTFVIDPYTAYILDKLKEVSKNLPQYNWGETMRIYFVPNSYTSKMGDAGDLYQFKSAKITYEEIIADRNHMVVKDGYRMRNIFAERGGLQKSSLIYSMWDGYLEKDGTFWETNNIPIIKIHSSGHAYVEDLQKFVSAVKPKYVVPNHTFYPEQYESVFDCTIRQVNDGQTIEI